MATATTNRSAGKGRGLSRRRGTTIADWESCSGDILKRAIAQAAITGGALRFGYSRDGGAYAVGIYGDGDVYTVWCRPDEDLDSLLLDIIELFEAIRDEQMSVRGLDNDAKPKKRA
jgi:hypothetical protein